MVAGVHFLPDDPPDLVGRKLLRVNLSDLAAKGATPLGYLMTVSTPRDTPDAWFAGFAAGLQQDQATYGVTLLGGDTTSTPGPISLSLTIRSAMSRPARRCSAPAPRPGDGIWVTGTIGDGALGLAVARGQLDRPDRPPAVALPPAAAARRPGDRRHRLGRHGCVRRPGAGPRPHLPGQQCRGARSTRHWCRCRNPARAAGADWLATCLTGGDDYELLLAVPRDARSGTRRGGPDCWHHRHTYRQLPLRLTRGRRARLRRATDGA